MLLCDLEHKNAVWQRYGFISFCVLQLLEAQGFNLILSLTRVLSQNRGLRPQWNT